MMNPGFTQPESMSEPQVMNANDPSAFDPNMGGNSTILPNNVQMAGMQQQQFQQPQQFQQQQFQQPMQQQQMMPPQQMQPQQPAKYKPPHCIYVRDDGNVIITVALPGIAKDAIDIEYDEPVIRIKAKSAAYEDDMTELKIANNVGMYFGDIDLEFKMTKMVDSLDASIEDGMLYLTINFRSKKEPAKIKLK